MRTLQLHEYGIELKTRDTEVDLVTFSEWRVFIDWAERARRSFLVRSVEVQSVDIVGNDESRRILFAKIKVDATDDAGRRVPGIIKLRGDVVCAVVVGVWPDGRKELIKVVQPRLSIAEPAFQEVVAGMFDDGDPVDKIVEEIKEETGIAVSREDVIDLTAIAYPDVPRGIACFPGSVDALSRVYCVHVTLDDALIATLDGVHGVADENEHTRTELSPIETAWTTMPDALSLAALFLYEKIYARFAA